MNIRQALQKANKVLQKRIDETLNNEVFREVRQEETIAIQKAVLDAYEPVIYQRRDYEGIDDPVNIEIEGGKAVGGVLKVINTTQPSSGGCLENGHVTVGKNLPELIEYGHGYKGYFYDFRPKGRMGMYMKPRPFTRLTIQNLKKSGGHLYAMREGLRKRGVHVR